MFLGVRAVVAKSIERIHAANLINFGILPLCFANPADYDRLKPDDQVLIPNLRAALTENNPLVLRNESANLEIQLVAAFSERQRQILLAGSLLLHVSKG